MQAPGRALRTCMNAAESGYDGAATSRSTQTCFSIQHSSPPATRTSLVHASRVTTSPLVRRRRRLLGATLAAGGRCLQCSLDPMCEDNSRFHSNCVWVDRPCAAQAPVLLGCTADRLGPRNSCKLRKYCSRRCNASATRSAVDFVHQLKTGSYFGPKFRLGVSDPRAQATLDLRPLNDAEGVGPCREATSSVISNQLLQR